MKHSLLIRVESSDDKIIHVVHRPKGWEVPEGVNEKARMMELEFNAISLAFQDIVEFWEKRGMMSKQQACGIMGKFCYDLANTEDSSEIEIFNADDLGKLPNLNEILKIVR